MHSYSDLFLHIYLLFIHVLLSIFCFTSAQELDILEFGGDLLLFDDNETEFGYSEEETGFGEEEGSFGEEEGDFGGEENSWDEEEWDNEELSIVDISEDEACFHDVTCIRNVNYCDAEGCCYWKECDQFGVCNLSAIC